MFVWHHKNIQGVKRAFRIDYNASKSVRYVHLLATEEINGLHTAKKESLTKNQQIH